MQRGDDPLAEEVAGEPGIVVHRVVDEPQSGQTGDLSRLRPVDRQHRTDNVVGPEIGDSSQAPGSGPPDQIEQNRLYVIILGVGSEQHLVR